MKRKQKEKARKKTEKETCKSGKRNDLPVANRLSPLNQQLVFQKHVAVAAVKYNCQEDQRELFRVLIMKLIFTGAVCALGCMRMTLVQAKNGYSASAQDGYTKAA